MSAFPEESTEATSTEDAALVRARPYSYSRSSRRRPRSGQRKFSRVAVAWGVSLFLMLTGATASQAYWNASSTTITPSGTGATVNAMLVRSDSNAVTIPTSTRSGNMPFTYTNTGNIDSDWRFSFTTNSSASNSATFTTWPLNAGETCNAAATPHDSTTASGGAPAALTGHSNVGATVTICVRAVMTAANQQSKLGQTIAINATLAASVGTWPGGQSASANMTITDDQAPTAPSVTLDRVSGYSTRLTWPASTDNTAVSGYRIYRNSSATPVATVNASTLTYTDTSLAANTSYTFRVEAYDAAGNAASGSATTTTLNIVSNQSYYLYASYANKCVDVARVDSSVGTELHLWDCLGQNNQRFAFRPVGDGTYILEPQHATDTAIGVADGNYGTWVRLRNKNDSGVRWLAEPFRDGFDFKNDDTGLFMDVEGVSTANDAKITQWGGTGGVNQAYVLR